MSQGNPVEKDWKKPRYALTADLWYDETMPKLPRWSAKDVSDFQATHPIEGEQLGWLRWRNRVKDMTAIAAGSSVAAFVLLRKRHPAYAVVGFALGGIAGILYGDDLPHAYQRARYGPIDTTKVHNAFFSWWREKQHEKFYATNPSLRPGASAAAAATKPAAATTAAPAPAASTKPKQNAAAH